VRAVAVLAMLAVALSACQIGRRGAPERPPFEGPAAPVNADVRGSPDAPDRGFVLDPILQ